MNVLVDIKTTLFRNLPILAGICLCLYFSYHTISGDRSYSQLVQLEQSLKVTSMTLAELKTQHTRLEDQVSMMRPETLSSDLLEERIRVTLGYGQANEFVVIGN